VSITHASIADNFYGKSAFLTIKIEDENSDTELPPKLVSVQLLSFESGPQELHGQRCNIWRYLAF
jgi:hypothetical protein